MASKDILRKFRRVLMHTRYEKEWHKIAQQGYIRCNDKDKEIGTPEHIELNNLRQFLRFLGLFDSFFDKDTSNSITERQINPKIRYVHAYPKDLLIGVTIKGKIKPPMPDPPATMPSAMLRFFVTH